MHSGKRFLSMAAASLMVLAACQKPAETSTSSEPPPAPPETIAPQPPPAPAPEIAIATPPPSYLAPEGVYFLVAKVSLETDDGITGFTPGTMVRKSEDGRYRTQGGQFLTLAANQITNDLRVARQAAGADSAAQMALANASQMDAISAAKAATFVGSPTPARSGAAAASTPGSSALGSPRLGASSLNTAGGTTLGATHSQTKRALTMP